MAWDISKEQWGKLGRLGGEALQDLGYGLATAPNFSDAFGAAAMQAQRAQPARDAYAQLQQEQAEKQDTLNKTTEWLRQNGQSQWLAAVESGAVTPGDAFRAVLTAQNESAPKPIEINGQLVDPTTGAVIGDYRDPVGMGDAPSGYQWGQNGSLMPIPGGPADKGAERPPMNATIQKEIFDTDDAILSGESAIGSLQRAIALNPTAYDGPLAEQRGGFTGLFGDPSGQATIELKNEVTTNALNSLKAIFGAAPTEGERQILLDIQGSPSQPREVRQRIFEKALEAAEKRLEFNRQKASGLRTGDYFTAAPAASSSAGRTSGGVSWSIEP